MPFETVLRIFSETTQFINMKGQLQINKGTLLDSPTLPVSIVDRSLNTVNYFNHCVGVNKHARVFVLMSFDMNHISELSFIATNPTSIKAFLSV